MLTSCTTDTGGGVGLAVAFGAFGDVPVLAKNRLSHDATKLVRIVENTERVLAIELFNAAQALEFRRPLKSSWTIEKIFAKYRKVVPFIDDDTYMHPLIEKSIEFIR